MDSMHSPLLEDETIEICISDGAILNHHNNDIPIKKDPYPNNPTLREMCPYMETNDYWTILIIFGILVLVGVLIYIRVTFLF